MAYKGELGDYYCMAAKSVGLPCPDYKRIYEGFKLAYTEMAKKYPCFRYAAKTPNIVWWKTCVRNSFVQAGYEYDEETFEEIFRRIYASFGSAAPYTVLAWQQTDRTNPSGAWKYVKASLFVCFVSHILDCFEAMHVISSAWGVHFCNFFTD
ncbi:hypothetical protein ACJRO7_011258 [Eucalyptus globulus]|uniref:Uncharacterized protein n=1 Tax=Eucalyptus globulus TaxID=34317 RepID=A0ABD3LFL4_EUCGL